MSDKTPLDPNQPVLYIDHCRYRENFRRDALQLHVSLAEALRALHPRVKLQLRINEHGPPEEEGAFEVAIAATPAESPSDRQHIWTGLRRVPFAAKVPHVDDIITPVCNALQLVRDDDHTDGGVAPTEDGESETQSQSPMSPITVGQG